MLTYMYMQVHSYSINRNIQLRIDDCNPFIPIPVQIQATKEQA